MGFLLRRQSVLCLLAFSFLSVRILADGVGVSHDQIAKGGSSDMYGTNFWGAFVDSVAMIIATEIGDKTFFIAAVMAMTQPRLVVFAGAIGALAVMTVLSAMLGFALPSVLPKAYTHYASALLFLYFGMKMLKEGMEADGSGMTEELNEVEEELSMKKEIGSKKDEGSSGDVETATNTQPNGSGRASATIKKSLTKVMLTSFTMTFLAEWGDRSQIATIALAAAKNVVGVTVGGVVGHSLCTGLAVIGGRMLATRISEKTVHLVGGALFLLFGVRAFFFGEE